MVGMFITPDSIVPDFSNPQCLNRYAYCLNNPLMYVDPSGQAFGIDDLIIGALVGGLIGGTISEISGGDFWDGFLTGAISGACFWAAGEIIGMSNLATANAAGFETVVEAVAHGVEMMSPLAQAGIHAAAGAISGGINSGITGNDVGLGMLTGGLSGGIAKYAGGYIPGFENEIADFSVQLAGRTVIGGVVGGISSEIYGGGFGQGFGYGAWTAGFAFTFNDLFHDARAVKWFKKVYDALKMDPLQTCVDRANDYVATTYERSGIEKHFINSGPLHPLHWKTTAMWFFTYPALKATGNQDIRLLEPFGHSAHEH